MFSYERPVRFEDVDAAGIVFFPRFLGYCHEAMEAMLGPVKGGYAGLVVDRRLGLPAVRVEAEFKSPLRFGDVAKISVVVERIGRSSCTLRHTIARARGGAVSAIVRHVVVLSDLGTLTSTPLPEDVRTVLESHTERGTVRE
jgi:4-hydroxybenzoyl-CoA thioesterase